MVDDTHESNKFVQAAALGKVKKKCKLKQLHKK